MDSIWKKRKQQLQDFRRYLNKDNKVKKQEVPDGLYQACPNCNSTIRTLDLKNHLQEWALNTDGWKVRDSEKVYDLSTLDADAYKDTLFYKDRWMNENGLEQRIIVTFSFKYKECAYPD